MKKVPFKIQLLAVMLVLGAAFLGFQAQVRSAAENKEAAAASSSSFKLAVIDVQSLLTQSEAAKSIQSQINALRDQYQKEISEQEKKLKDTQGELAALKKKGTEADFNKKKDELEKGVNEARELVQKRRHALEAAGNEAIEKLREEITKIVAGMADKEKYDIVVTRQNVVLAVKSLDITKEVLEKLNASVTKIDVKPQTN